MRRHILPADAWLCLILSMMIALGTGYIAKQAAQKIYERELEKHQPVDGEIGGRADETAFRAKSVEDLLSHDTFTIVSPGIRYRNEGMGIHNNQYYYNVELPSGERIAAKVNNESVQSTGNSYYSGDNILPLGRVVWEDLTEDEAFLHQVEYNDPLTRKDFYVDMVGDTAVLAEDLAVETPVLMVQVLTVFICYPVFHALGSKLGFFAPYFLSTKKKRK